MSDDIQTTTNEEPAAVPAPIPVTLKDVAFARETVESTKRLAQAVEEAIAQTENGIRLAELRLSLNEYKTALGDVEDAYRAQCVAAYQSTGEKQQPGGVVKVYKSLTYDTGLAVEWSLKHGHAQLLKLNTTAFEKVAKELALEFVEATEEPRMTLASDLSEYLEE